MFPCHITPISTLPSTMHQDPFSLQTLQKKKGGGNKGNAEKNASIFDVLNYVHRFIWKVGFSRVPMDVNSNYQ